MQCPKPSCLAPANEEVWLNEGMATMTCRDIKSIYRRYVYNNSLADVISHYYWPCGSP